MTVSKKETASIRRFVCGQLRDEPDLSTLTLGILKKRYLAHVQCESLSPEAKNFMKQVVQEELVKMQDNGENESEMETKKLQNKRKREQNNDEVISGGEGEVESRAKKSRCVSSSSSESDDKEDCKTEHEKSEEREQIKSGSEDEGQEVKKSPPMTKRSGQQRINSEDSADEEINESEKEDDESDCDDSPKEMVKKKATTTKNGEAGNGDTSQEKKTQSDEENDTDTDNGSEKSDKINGNDSSDDSEKEEKVLTEKKDNDQDSDSSSLPSLEDERDSGTEKTKDIIKKKTKEKEKEDTARDKKDDNKAIVRLKRYIALCGVRRNYKKLLEGCRSIRSQVAALKKELEDLGVQGQPTIEKCKKVRKKREEAQDLAGLDVSNIIATQGRPKRQGASAWLKKPDPPSSTYARTLNCSSDSDQENNAHKGRRRATDWANLQGIISDDGDSD